MKTNKQNDECPKTDICSGTFLIMNILILFQGGLKAVVWTDAFQIVVMFAGMLGIVIQVGLLN